MTSPSSSSPEAPPERDQDTLRIGLALRAALHEFEAIRDKTAKELSLHHTDFSCIGFLYRNGPSSPRQVIAYLGLTSGSGTALFDRLENIGFIRRSPNPDDRRSVLIELQADRASEAVARYRRIEERYQETLKAFSNEELKSIARFMEAFAQTTKGLL